MNTSVLHDDESSSADIGDSGILFEKACGSEYFRVIKTGETTAITFGDRGVRNAECMHTFYDQILELIEQNQSRVLILDMRGVWFLPSRSLGALMSLRKAVDQIELHNVTEELRDNLRITQLDKLFRVSSCNEVLESNAADTEKLIKAVEPGPVDSNEVPQSLSASPEEWSEGVIEAPSEIASSTGKITQISFSKGPDFPQQGYGVISTLDGREVYFRANSLMNAEFSKLELGSEVRFVEEVKDDCRQANSVWLVIPHLVE